MTKGPVFWHEGAINRDDRLRLLGKKNMVIWLTGLSGSGKSTIAMELERVLLEKGYLSFVLDGDNLRHGLNKDIGFSPQDREENIRRVGEVTKLLYDAGVLVISSFISPYERDRATVRKLIGKRFLEVYVRCSLATCESRDTKGLYRKARNNEIKGFTGIDAPYEEPKNPEVTVDTESLSVEQAVELIAEKIVGFNDA